MYKRLKISMAQMTMVQPVTEIAWQQIPGHTLLFDWLTGQKPTSLTVAFS